jgi:hypothetical protein
MKTKSLTFILSLTFLFFFSGSVYGGVFDKGDEKVGLFCDDTLNQERFGDLGSPREFFLFVNTKDKVIKIRPSYDLLTRIYPDFFKTFKITNENEMFLEGEVFKENLNDPLNLFKKEDKIDKKESPIMITKHEFKNQILVRYNQFRYGCSIGIKRIK